MTKTTRGDAPTRINDRLISVTPVAAAYGCSVTTVWRHVATGVIPKPVKIGGMTRWSEAEVLAHIEAAKDERGAE